MTFDEQYPDAETWFQIPADQYNEVIKCPASEPCWQCGTPTHFVELNFEAHICSAECNDAAWRKYFQACRESDRRYWGSPNETEGVLMEYWVNAGGECDECGRKVTWQGNRWGEHTASYHDYWRQYWIERFIDDLWTVLAQKMNNVIRTLTQ